MAKWESLDQPGLSVEVDRTMATGRGSLWPIDYREGFHASRGHYRSFGQTLAITPTANAFLSLLRWDDPHTQFILLRVFVTVTVATAVTAQRVDPLKLSIARKYTNFETTATLLRALQTDQAKLRTIMGTSLFRTGGSNGASIADSSAAGGMTGGSHTDDVNPLSVAAFTSALGGVGTGLTALDLYRWDGLGSGPVVLGVEEGLVLSWGATTLTTGTIIIGTGYEWVETPNW